MMTREEVETLIKWYEEDRDSISHGLAVLTLGIKVVPMLLDQNAALAAKLKEKDLEIARLKRDLSGFMECY